MPARRSRLSYQARLAEAFELYDDGFLIRQVAENMHISEDTAARYRLKWKEHNEAQANEDRSILQDTLQNTVRTLAQINRVRSRAASDYAAASNPQTRAALLNVQLKCLDQISKLLGLAGLKPEVLARVAAVRDLQGKLLQYLERELCSTDRAKLERWLVNEFGDQLAAANTVDDILRAAAT